MLGPRGYAVLKSEIEHEEYLKIKKELTVSANLQDYGIKPTEFKLYQESAKKIYLPKAYALSKFGLPGIIKLTEATDISVEFIGKLRDLQITATKAMLDLCNNPLKGGGILCLQCGEGKCLARDTPVLLYSREIVMVQDITKHSILLGDDNLPRNVLSVCNGYDNMYEIVPLDRRCMRYTVNSVHILSLLYEYRDNMFTDIDINIKEYLRMPKISQDKFYTYKAGKLIKSQFDIYPAGYAEYFGFIIDGNHRFQLGDTTVTHNTISAIYMITILAKKTLIIVHKEFLMQQWRDRINEFAPNARIGTLRGKILDIQNKDIVIGMLQSISMKDYESNIFDGFGTVVIDECFPYHQYIVTKSGSLPIGKIYNMWNRNEELPDVYSYNKTTKEFEWKKITYAWKKPYNGKLIKIAFSLNSIKCTPDHKHLTLTKGMVESKNLQVGDLIISSYNDNSNISSTSKALNDDQYQILLGSILGDGCIHKTGSDRFRLRIIHGIKQRDYCEWKAYMFDVKTIYIEKNGYSQTPAIAFNTKIIDFEKEINFTNKKTVPQWVIDNIDARGIAIWYMDDGSISKDHWYSIIHSNTFDKETHIRFVKKFESLNINCVIKKSKRYYCLYFNEDATRKLFNLILPYIHSSMKYKLLTNIIIQDYNEYYYNINNNYRRIQNIQNFKLNDIYNINKVKYIYEKCINKNHDSLHLIRSDRYNKCCICSYTRDITRIEPCEIKQFNTYIWNHEFLNYGTQRISKIEYIDNNDKYDKKNVYDIEVEDNHTFICCAITSTYGNVTSNCHHTSAEVFSKALKKITFKYSIGLTATPKRVDGLTKVFKWFLGDIGYTSKKRTDEVNVVIYKYSDANPEYSEEERIYNGKINLSKMINNICAYQPRVIFIVDIIIDILKEEPGRKIILVSDRKGHLLKLGELLKLRDYDPGYFYGGLKEWQLKAAENKNILLCTVQMVKEGYDQKGLDTLILASPKSDIIQISGRILRDKPEERKYTPLIIDILDDFSIFVNQGKKRQTYYKKCKYNIISKFENIEEVKTIKYDKCIIADDS